MGSRKRPPGAASCLIGVADKSRIIRVREGRADMVASGRHHQPVGDGCQRLLRVLGARFGTLVGQRSSAILRYRTDFDGRSCHLAGRALRALQYWQEIARLLPVAGEGRGRRDARSRSSISSCVGALKQVSSALQSLLPRPFCAAPPALASTSPSTWPPTISPGCRNCSPLQSESTTLHTTSSRPPSRDKVPTRCTFQEPAKHLQAYLDELTFRHNRRKTNGVERIARASSSGSSCASRSPCDH